MSVEIIKSKIRDVVDFPQKGIVFRDLTTVFKGNCRICLLPYMPKRVLRK